MVIRYNCSYISNDGDTISVTTKVVLPYDVCKIGEPEIIRLMSLHDPLNLFRSTDTNATIRVEDDHRNLKQYYHSHNGHYAKLNGHCYFWINSQGKPVAPITSSYVDDSIQEDIQATIDTAKKLWHLQ